MVALKRRESNGLSTTASHRTCEGTVGDSKRKRRILQKRRPGFGVFKVGADRPGCVSNPAVDSRRSPQLLTPAGAFFHTRCANLREQLGEDTLEVEPVASPARLIYQWIKRASKKELASRAA
jgi:hypothetical protein